MAEQQTRTFQISWAEDSGDHEYHAAETYLGLIHARDEVVRIVDSFRDAPVIELTAKDIFRASELSPEGLNDFRVEQDRDKIRRGLELAPILLVQEDGKAVIADRYHRLCAAYSFDQSASIACKVVPRK